MNSFEKIIEPFIEWEIFLDEIKELDEHTLEFTISQYKLNSIGYNEFGITASIDEFLTTKKDQQYFARRIIQIIDFTNNKLKSIPAYLMEILNKEFIHTFIMFENISKYLKENYLNIKEKSKLPKYHLENFIYSNKREFLKEIAQNEFGELTDSWKVKENKVGIDSYIAFLKVVENKGYFKQKKKISREEKDMIITETFGISCRSFQNNNYSFPDSELHFNEIIKSNNSRKK